MGNGSGIEDRKVLIVSYSFAPNSRVGGKRFSFLTTQLVDRVGELHVLTVDKRHIARKDPTIPFAGIVHRTGMYPPYPFQARNQVGRAWNRLWSSYLCMLDPFSGWIPTAVTTGSRLIDQYEIDLLIATGPPFSSHVIGRILSDRHDLSLVLDYRDPWTNRKEVVYPRLGGEALNKAMERRCIQSASAIVLNTPAMQRDFQTAFSPVLKSPTVVINNGYMPCMAEPLPLGGVGMNVVYAGNLYGRRSLALLGDGVARLIKEGAVRPDMLRFHIFGRIMDADRPMLAAMGIEELFVEHAPVDHETIVKILKGADALLLLVGQDMDYSISYKFYDYLSVRRPILALVPSGSQMMETMRKVDCGPAVDCEDRAAVYGALKDLLSRKNRYTFTGAEQFTWEECGHRYYELLRALSGSSSGIAHRLCTSGAG
jgi:glycosyltransferase involved in cell wall biosynthesis